jgi:hypothetical protein
MEASPIAAPTGFLLMPQATKGAGGTPLEGISAAISFGVDLDLKGRPLAQFRWQR